MITVVQITTSETHGGSRRVYLHIQKIMKQVRELATQEYADASVKVVYCLAFPEGNTSNYWEMHPGWNVDIEIDNHRGPASSEKVAARLFAVYFTYLRLFQIICHRAIKIR